MQLQRNRIYRKQVYKSGTIFNVGPTTARYLILLLLGVFSLLFLVQSTQGAQTSAEISKQDNLRVTGQQELTTLGVQRSRLLSLEQLNQMAQTDGLVPIGNPEPVTVPPTGSKSPATSSQVK